MTLQVSEIATDSITAPASVASPSMNDRDSVAEEQQYRASAYGLMAALLRQPPNQVLLDQVADLGRSVPQEGDDIMLSMSALGLSAGMHDPESIEDEFHELFIGLGKGELTPYASWYLTGFLMEQPLSDLRQDLQQLGYQRSDEVHEPEDHAAALCEVMSMMILEGIDLDRQQNFFNRHIQNWMGRFMQDLSAAQAAIFYQALGRFGAAFMRLEDEYLSMQS